MTHLSVNILFLQNLFYTKQEISWENSRGKKLICGREIGKIKFFITKQNCLPICECLNGIPAS